MSDKEGKEAMECLLPVPGDELEVTSPRKAEGSGSADRRSASEKVSKIKI